MYIRTRLNFINPPKPHFPMYSSGCRRDYVFKYEWYFIASRKGKKSFLHLLFRMMVKGADLNEFDRE